MESIVKEKQENNLNGYYFVTNQGSMKLFQNEKGLVIRPTAHVYSCSDNELEYIITKEDYELFKMFSDLYRRYITLSYVENDAQQSIFPKVEDNSIIYYSDDRKKENINSNLFKVTKLDDEHYRASFTKVDDSFDVLISEKKHLDDDVFYLPFYQMFNYLENEFCSNHQIHMDELFYEMSFEKQRERINN